MLAACNIMQQTFTAARHGTSRMFMESISDNHADKDCQTLKTQTGETIGMSNKRAVAERATMQVAHVSTLLELTGLLLEACAR